MADSERTLPFRPWFKPGWADPTNRDHQDNRAMLAAVELANHRARGPRPAPTAEPVPGCPVRATAWEAAYERRVAAGFDPGSAAALTTTTHGPRLVPRVEPPAEPAAEG